MIKSFDDPVLSTVRLMGGDDDWALYMGTWFDVTEYMYLAGFEVPSEWEFHASDCLTWDSLSESPIVPEIDTVRNLLVAEGQGEEALADYLRQVGRILSLLCTLVKAAGKDY